jgi:hypothetical protein
MKRKVCLYGLIMTIAFASCGDGAKQESSGGYDVETDSIGENIDSAKGPAAPTDSVDTAKISKGENAPPKPGN